MSFAASRLPAVSYAVICLIGNTSRLWYADCLQERLNNSVADCIINKKKRIPGIPVLSSLLVSLLSLVSLGVSLVTLVSLVSLVSPVPGDRSPVPDTIRYAS